MPFFKSMPPDAGPPNVSNTYPGIYKSWATMSQNTQARIKLGYLNLYPQFKGK